MNQIFEICCEIIRTLAAWLGMSYSACNILIFLHILPALYLLLSMGISISGFFKKNFIFGITCIILGGISSLYVFEMLFYNLSEYTLDVESFNKSVDMLNHHAQMFNCTYQEINIIYFIIVPIVVFTTFLILISTNNKTRKRDQ